MPTVRPRHVITENDQVGQALDDAARRWPEDRESRPKLLLHLVQEGHRAVLEQAEANRNARLAAVRRTSGVLTGTYEAGYLDRLRDDWPA
jgi:hypothetical protein